MAWGCKYQSYSPADGPRTQQAVGSYRRAKLCGAHRLVQPLTWAEGEGFWKERDQDLSLEWHRQRIQPPSSIISCCWDGKSSAACSASARKINRDQDRAAGKTPCSPIEQRISKTSRNSMTKIRFRLDLPHHKTQLGKGWTVCWPGTHARFYNSLQRRWNRQFDKACNWPVRVNHAFDAISDVKNIGFG